MDHNQTETSIMSTNTTKSVIYCPHIPQLIWDAHDTISPWIFAAVACIISPVPVLLNALVNTLDNTDTETISLFIDSLVVSALQDAGGYAISRQNDLELHLGYHTCWLSYFTLVCLWCGRTVSQAGGRFTVTWWPNFLMGRLLHFPTHGAPLARFARELRYDNDYGLFKYQP